MGYRNIIIESNASLSLKNDQLIIETQESFSLPIEDINSVLIESRQASISTALLSFLAQNGVCVFFCDEKHLPCALLLPFMQHSRQLKIIKSQLDTTLPLKKQLWKEIVKSKITNQSMVLRFSGKFDEADKIEILSKNIKSGDSENVEATAAMQYFPALFGSEFRRSDENDLRNSALNYGYAIIRGQVARLLTSYGFLPCFGINHHSELNSFNLADDIIEPFRPLVDLFVVTNVGEQEGVLTPDLKRKLVNLLSYNIEIEDKKYALSYAIEVMIKSLSFSITTQSVKLKLPVLQELCLHSYE